MTQNSIPEAETGPHINRIRLYVVEEQEILREAYKAVLPLQPDIDVAAISGDSNINTIMSVLSVIKAEWVGRINGLVFTIYDYKSKLDPERNTDWHIGGKQKFAAELVNLYFKAHQ